MKTEIPKHLAARIRAALEARLARHFDIDPKELPALSLSDIVSLLFLLYGDTNSLASAGGSAGSIIALVGKELFWETPKPEQPASTAVH